MSPETQRAQEQRVLIVPPTRRDGDVTCKLLAIAEVGCVACRDLRSLAACVEQGVGAVMLTDSALMDPQIDVLHDTLARQAGWSDVPVLLLTHGRELSPPAARALARLSNVTLLDRPVSTRSMVSAVLAALRARQRQYQIRDQLARQHAAEQALVDADRRKDEFLATLAHELRNPLAPIRTAMHVLARVPPDAPQATRLREMMERQIEQLVKLIDELLDVSRIATGKVLLQRERVDLRSVLDSALEASRPQVDASNHDMRVSCSAAPIWVVGDPSRLAQVISNLINNAAKYTPARGRIDVALEEADQQAIVRVTDNGAGIPVDMLDRVFDMFTQVNRTLDRAQGGLGIGLSLVRRLVDLHGGSVSAASPGLDKGSTFTIRLPMVEAEPMIDAAGPQPPDRAPVRRRMRVLVVDDNVDAADALAIQLETGGHEIRTAYGGAAALHAADEFGPEVVLCDIGMPGIDGHAVAMRLRADRRHASTVLVALTGWGSEEDRRRTRRTGFDFHLVKPVSAEAVDEILSRI
jgi:signal transduction histidine kinase/CheY-like chemotaxis protein